MLKGGITLYYPTLPEARALLSTSGPEQPNTVPICRDVVADLETPVSAYLKVTNGDSVGSFLLESVEGGERIARYSFIGTSPRSILRLEGGRASVKGLTSRLPASCDFVDPLEVLATELRGYLPADIPGLPRFRGGAVGYLAYDAVHYFERLPRPAADPLGLPEGVFLFTDTLLIFDHLRHRITVLTHARLDRDIEAEYAAAVERIEGLIDRLKRPLSVQRPKPALPSILKEENEHGGSTTSPVETGRSARSRFSSLEAEAPVGDSSPDEGLRTVARDARLRRTIEPDCCSNYTQPEFEAAVRRAKEYIEAGDAIQVVLSQRLSRPTVAAPFDVYRALRTLNPSPYMYYLNLGECVLVGASPELLVRVEDGLVTTHPIAGTRPRGQNRDEDARLEAELRADEKEKAEHIMLVDLGRNDLGRVCEPGSVRVPQLMGVERYSHVMHLVSHVTGRLRADRSPFDALRACFPAGTVSGAPKVRAMEIIAELERDARGPYAGAVGYFDYRGALDTCITIRTIVMRNGMAHIQAGAGIVADSVPEVEYRETLNKAQALLKALDSAESAYQVQTPHASKEVGSDLAAAARATPAAEGGTPCCY